MATWSGIRQKLEQECLAESLKGHIQYFATTYRESHDREGRAAILFDGEEIVRGAFLLKDFHSGRNPHQMDEFALTTGGFDQIDFYCAFDEFDNQSIEKSLESDNLIVRILAILDRRVGKRRLIAMKDDISKEPETFQKFYSIRAEAEGI